MITTEPQPSPNSPEQVDQSRSDLYAQYTLPERESFGREHSREELSAFIQRNFSEDRRDIVSEAIERAFGGRRAINEAELLTFLNLSLLDQPGNPWNAPPPREDLGYSDLQILERLDPNSVGAPRLDLIQAVFLEVARDNASGIRSHNLVVREQFLRNNPDVSHSELFTVSVRDFGSQAETVAHIRRIAELQQSLGRTPFDLNVSTAFYEFERDSLESVVSEFGLPQDVTLTSLHSEPHRSAIYDRLPTDLRDVVDEFRLLADAGVRVYLALGNDNRVNLLAVLLRDHSNIQVVGGLDPDGAVAGINRRVAPQAELFAPSTIEVRAGNAALYQDSEINEDTLVQYLDWTDAGSDLRVLGQDPRRLLATQDDVNRLRESIEIITRIENLTFGEQFLQSGELESLELLNLPETLRGYGIELPMDRLATDRALRSEVIAEIQEQRELLLSSAGVSSLAELRTGFSHLVFTPEQYDEVFDEPLRRERFPSDPKGDDIYFLNIGTIENSSSAQFDLYTARTLSDGGQALVWINQGTSFATPSTIHR